MTRHRPHLNYLLLLVFLADAVLWAAIIYGAAWIGGKL